MSLYGDLKIFGIDKSLPFAKAVCSYLDQPVGKLSFKKFADGEWWCQFDENIRGCDIFLIASTNPPVDNWFQLWIAIDAARRASARRVTVVMPYMGYGRQERKDKSRVAITASMVLHITSGLKINRFVSMDIHKGAIQGFVQDPFDHLFGSDTLLEDIKQWLIKNDLTKEQIVAVAPDEGAISLVRPIAKRHGWRLAAIDKSRIGHNQVEEKKIFEIFGEKHIQDSICVVIDDIVDTAGTLCKGVKSLKKAGAKMVLGAITHGLLSEKAVENIHNSSLEKIWVSDTIGLKPKARQEEKIKVVSVAPRQILI